MLLGSIKRKYLSKLLSDHLSAEKRLQYMLSQSDESAQIPAPVSPPAGMGAGALETRGGPMLALIFPQIWAGAGGGTKLHTLGHR